MSGKSRGSERLIAAALVLAGGYGGSGAWASSHNDAPLIKQDPQINLTDVYAFVGRQYNDPSTDVLNIIVNVRPFSEPGDGPHYERFASDAVYSLHVADPATGVSLFRYDFRFTSPAGAVQNPNTILSYGLGTAAGPIQMIGDAQQNFTQRYTVERFSAQGMQGVVQNVVVGLPNVGKNVTPLYNDANGMAVSGAQTEAELDPYTQQAVHCAITGETVFAGPRDDSFYGDVPGVFDLLDVRILDNNGDLGDGLGQDGNGVDGFKGFNVLTYGIQIPLDQLPSLPYNDAFFGPQTGVGVYASVSRFRVTQRLAGDTIINSRDFVQMNRLGNPLFNETLVALVDKDRYNATSPNQDAQFATYAEKPELAGLINFVFGTAFATEDRADLVAVFIPDVLRVATTTGPVTLSGEPGFSRFGFVGGDMTGGVSSGWPNGRRFGDDVIDIALTAIASGPAYETITVVGDNVAGNDMLFHRVFPYAATPHSGSNNRKDPVPPAGMTGDLDADGDVDIHDLIILLKNFDH
ncbi:MAG: DUF4331 domain-containing protein [Phycisphaerales bacterium]|nr:DUF4331 domain-containing protein [Phycisphaerales bacterium]